MDKNDLTLEKLEIANRLRTLETKFDVLVSRMESHADNDSRMFKAITENLDKLNIIIIGDGKSAGLAEDMRKTKNIQEAREGHIKVLYVAIIGGFCDFIWRNVQHFFNHKG